MLNSSNLMQHRSIVAGMVISVVVGLFFILLGTVAMTENAFAAIGMGLGTGLASLGVGAFLGFLFGIPRALTGAQETPVTSGGQAAKSDQQTPSMHYTGNTNLEQISDWLTKILVGVGLVQLSLLPSNLEQFTRWLGGAMGPNTSTYFSGLFAVEIAYFGVVGFIGGYLGTRLWLPGAFNKAEFEEVQHAVENLRQNVQSNSERIQSLQAQQEAQRARDYSAMYRANTRLVGSAEISGFEITELQDAVRDATVWTRTVMLFLAQYERLNSGSPADMDKLLRTRVVFDALARTTKPENAEEEKANIHQYYANLAYTYKDQQPPDFDTAIQFLDLAIQERDKVLGAPSGGRREWDWYEIDRAMCRLQRALKLGAVGADDTAKIRADLSGVIAGTSKFRRAAAPLGSQVRAWLDDNGIPVE